MPTFGRLINPSQVVFDGSRFVAVTKEGDWWGTKVLVDVAPAAQGPWRTVAEYTSIPLCADCTTYFASIVAYREPGRPMIVGISNNTWQGFSNPYYRPTFLEVTVPS
jgi:hypothetical protein